MCRQCLVEVKGQPKLVPSCYTPVAENMDVLTESEKTNLAREEGKWPEYPRTLLELARKHRLGVPGMTLPGPRGWWENGRPGALKPQARSTLPSGAGPGT